MRDDEIQAARLLDDLLRNNGCGDISWSPGPDPPDFDFLVNGERWAVEVTHLEQQLLVSGRGLPNPQSRRNWHKKIERLRKNLEAELKGIPHRKRSYGITIRGCTPEETWRGWKQRLIKRIVEHVANDRGDLISDSSFGADVRVFGSGDNVTVTTMTPLDAPHGYLSTDFAAAERTAFEDAFDRKHSKLMKLEGYTRVVLLLINDYWAYDFLRDAHAGAAMVARALITKFPGIDYVYLQIRDDLRKIV